MIILVFYFWTAALYVWVMVVTGSPLGKIRSHLHSGYWPCLITMDGHGKISWMTGSFSSRLPFLTIWQPMWMQMASLKCMASGQIWRVLIRLTISSSAVFYLLVSRCFGSMSVNVRPQCTIIQCFTYSPSLRLFRSLTRWFDDILQIFDVCDVLAQDCSFDVQVF